ncbi:MAG: hypothetical protein Q8P41_14265 [Pseudomonadota bacterium]|nr:hypothetical protein [Pseudomonadota bacterium]
MSRTDAAGLVTEGNLFDFFHERVESAVLHQRAPVSENAVYYLSSLLADQARREDEAVEAADATLVELRHRAVMAAPPEAVSLWRKLGDRSLLLTGFFREHLERRHISRDYCVRMGETAYRSLERLLDARGGGFAEIFAELAERYPACVEVIAEVRDETRERSDTDIVRLYEEWLTSGSPRVAERLRQLGLVPTRAVGSG